MQGAFEGASFKEGSAWEGTHQIVIRTWLVVEHRNECGEYPGMLRGILSVSQNKRVYLNNVMYHVRVKERPHMKAMFIRHARGVD